MKLSSYFNDFIVEISLTEGQRDAAKTGHTTLRDRLMTDESLKPVVITTFLQGSYKRHTGIRPIGDERSDVDIVVVTNLDKDVCVPEAAYDLFNPFLEKHYSGKYRRQGRSFGITLSYVDLDFVITSAPSEATREALLSKSIGSNLTLEEAVDWRLNSDWIEPVSRRGLGADFIRKAQDNPEWKTEPLLIPDRELHSWQPTHPIAQLQWTRDKNRNTDGNFTKVVRIVKWLHRSDDSMPKHPKGYLIEHLVGEVCPDHFSSLAESVTISLEEISERYAGFAAERKVPKMLDHGLPSQDVFSRITGDEFKRFHSRISLAATQARGALDSDDANESASRWRELFGNKFPTPPGGTGGFTPRVAPTVPSKGTFA